MADLTPQQLMDPRGEAIKQFEKMAKSDDPVEAASGRLLGLLNPVIADWIDAEKALETPAGPVLIALAKACVTEVSSLALSMSKPDQHSAVVAKCADCMHMDMMAIAESDDLLSAVETINAVSKRH